MNKLNEQEFRDRIDLNIREHMEANNFKQSLSSLGYAFTVSLYGVIYNGIRECHEYRRIEIFLNKPPDQITWLRIKAFFDEFIPYNYFSIWLCNVDTQQITFIEGWD